MSELLNSIVGYPGVVVTVLLGVSLAYWLLVVLGALHIDVLGGHGLGDGGIAHGAVEGAAQGAAEGVAHGAAEGVAHGAVEGAVHGAVKGVAEAAANSVAHVPSHGPAAEGVHGSGASEAVGLLSLANLRSVPVTVMLSVVTCFAWLFCVLGSRYLKAVESSLPLPWWLLGTILLLLCFVLALVPAAITIRPLGRFFVTHQATTHAQLVGKICVVTTGKVDRKFGQASLESEGMSLLIQVRADSGSTLKKGQRALILQWDRDQQAFLIEPYEAMLDKS